MSLAPQMSRLPTPPAGVAAHAAIEPGCTDSSTPRDTALGCRLAQDRAQRYWLFVPSSAAARGADAPLMFSVHGISRNAGAHLKAFAPWAQLHGCVLVAPHFSKGRFADYQRLGRATRLGAGGRADLTLLRIEDEVRARLGLRTQPLHLFGHSGGAQFVQRFVLVHAHRVSRYALSAAGSYAWPDDQRRFPFGLAHSARFVDLKPNLPSALDKPGLVLVGSADHAAQASLRSGPRVESEQGASRVERATRYVAAVQARAAHAGAQARISLELLEGCGHGFSQCVRHGDLARRVMSHLFGPLDGPARADGDQTECLAAG